MYEYEIEKPKLFTDQGQRDFLEMRDKVQKLLQASGAIMLEKGMIAGDSWFSLACFDRLVELGELKEIKRECAGQHRVFISAKC